MSDPYHPHYDPTPTVSSNGEPIDPAGTSWRRSQSFWTLLGRALRLRCPVCGRGAMFRGLLTMNKRCSCCGLWYERESGYFLGSIYFNYTLTAVIASAVYLVPMLILGRPPTWLLAPVVAFCVVFPLFFFRYARSLWLAFQHYLSPLDETERPKHER